MRMLTFGQPQPLPAPGSTWRDHLHPCSMPERPQAWSPSNVHAVVSGVHNGRHDRTAGALEGRHSIAPRTRAGRLTTTATTATTAPPLSER